MEEENINIRIGRAFLREGKDKAFVIKQMKNYEEQLGMLPSSKEVTKAKKDIAAFIAELESQPFNLRD